MMLSAAACGPANPVVEVEQRWWKESMFWVQSRLYMQVSEREKAFPLAGVSHHTFM